MLSGARSLYAISQWGRDQGLEVSQALGFTRERTPCVSTLHQVFSRLDRASFELTLGKWLAEQGLQDGEALAIDGKTLRGIHGEQLPGVHLLAAYAHQSGIVVGQQAVGEKKNELDALPRLLDQLDLRGPGGDRRCPVYPKEGVPTDCSPRGHYFFTVKDNQPTLKEDICAIWEGETTPQAVQIGQHGGRVEQRRLWASDLLTGYSDWPHLAQACWLERITHRKRGTRRESAYAVTSLPPEEADAVRLLNLWRGHWGIENRVHWVRDVTLDEDRSQVRTGAAPQIMAGLRNLTISLLRLTGEPNIASRPPPPRCETCPIPSPESVHISNNRKTLGWGPSRFTSTQLLGNLISGSMPSIVTYLVGS